MSDFGVLSFEPNFRNAVFTGKSAFGAEGYTGHTKLSKNPKRYTHQPIDRFARMDGRNGRTDA
jgi:hypothetical protein